MKDPLNFNRLVETRMQAKDLKGKYVLIYGQPKTGKTTLAC